MTDFPCRIKWLRDGTKKVDPSAIFPLRTCIIHGIIIHMDAAGAKKGETMSNARKAVQMASKLVSGEAKQWLWWDERGTWEKRSSDLLERASVHPKRAEFTEEQVAEQVATILALEAASTIERRPR